MLISLGIDRRLHKIASHTNYRHVHITHTTLHITHITCTHHIHYTYTSQVTHKLFIFHGSVLVAFNSFQPFTFLILVFFPVLAALYPNVCFLYLFVPLLFDLFKCFHGFIVIGSRSPEIRPLVYLGILLSILN